MKPVAVQTSITVSGTPDNDARVPTVTETVPEKTIADANVNEQFQSLLPMVPGVVRGPDGRINMKGTRNTTERGAGQQRECDRPGHGGPAINLPIDVVSSVQVISNPYDPAVRQANRIFQRETKTGDYEKPSLYNSEHPSASQGPGRKPYGHRAFKPRMTFTGPIWKDHIAITQSIGLPACGDAGGQPSCLNRDRSWKASIPTRSRIINMNTKQTATVSVTVYPQKLDYMGLNTFTPQPSTTDFHQRGYQIYGQHRLAHRS